MKNKISAFFKTPISANKHEFPTPNLRMNIVPMFYELNTKKGGRTTGFSALNGEVEFFALKNWIFAVFFLCEFFSSLFLIQFFSVSAHYEERKTKQRSDKNKN